MDVLNPVILDKQETEATDVMAKAFEKSNLGNVNSLVLPPLETSIYKSDVSIT